MAHTIQEFVTERSIKSLVHFTRLSNLPSILQRGLLTRDVLIREGNLEALNDQYRRDHTNAICLSIGFPNYETFSGLRQNNPGTDWVIVAIFPRVLWQIPCAFYVTDAGAAQASAIPLEQRMTLDALRDMYRDVDGKTRGELALGDDLPTNPRAEVLVMEGIPTRDIMGILVPDGTTQAKVEALRPRLNVRVHAHFFSERYDCVDRGNA